jgi:hypothetical protein
LGCAMTDSILFISNYLKKEEYLDNIKVHFVEYLYILNMLADRMETVLYMIKNDDEYNKKEFAIFEDLREWIYFFKPHTTCITTQKAHFIFETTILNPVLNDKKYTIDKHFVKEYYKSRGKNGEHIKDKYVVLVLPNISDMTHQICTVLDSFLALLCNNDCYLDAVLKME